MLGQDCSLLCLISEGEGSIEFVWYLLAASDVTDTKNILSCRQYSQITDIIFWPCWNHLCKSLIYLFCCSANVRISCLEQVKSYFGKHSSEPARRNLTKLFPPKRLTHWLVKLFLTLGDLSWISVLLNIRVTKGCQNILSPEAHVHQIIKRMSRGSISVVDYLYASSGQLHPFHLAPPGTRRLTLGATPMGSFSCLTSGKLWQEEREVILMWEGFFCSSRSLG